MKPLKTLQIATVATVLVLGSGMGTMAIAEESSDVMADVLTEKDILAKLNGSPGLNATAIGVSCLNGVVTLRGMVESGLERELAARIAAGIPGVKSVNNNLQTTS